jgi:Predicted nucleic acid-binding protein, contains PIN domain
MVVVRDTSPISGLYRIGYLHLLQLLYKELIIPSAVFEELAQLQDFGYDLEAIIAADWIKIKSPLQTKLLSDILEELDQGEAEAIALSKEMNADLLLIDEIKGRKLAKESGLLVIGLLGVLVEAKEEGHIFACKTSFGQTYTREANFRVSAALYKFVIEQVGE